MPSDFLSFETFIITFAITDIIYLAWCNQVSVYLIQGDIKVTFHSNVIELPYVFFNSSMYKKE